MSANRPQILLFCSESGQPLQRHIGTDNSSGRHKCTCHNEYCVVKCNVCGFIGYTSLGSHGQAHKSHIIEKESGTPPLPNRGKKRARARGDSDEDESASDSSNDDSDSKEESENTSSDDDTRTKAPILEDAIDSMVPFMSSLMQARVNGLIGDEPYQSFKPLILTKWNEEELTVLFLKLKECLGNEDGKKKWDEEGMPLFNSILALYAK